MLIIIVQYVGWGERGEHVQLSFGQVEPKMTNCSRAGRKWDRAETFHLIPRSLLPSFRSSTCYWKYRRNSILQYVSRVCRDAVAISPLLPT